MGTIGTFELNLTNLGSSVNNGVRIAEGVTGGVADQGSLIGLAIGISIAVLLLFGVVLVVINFIPQLIGKVKGLKHA